MCHDKFLCDDLADFYFRVVLAMPFGALVLLFALELEYDDLFAAARRSDGGANDGASGFGAGQHRALVREHGQHFGELDFGADVAAELGDAQHVAGFDTILFSAGLNNGMHWRSLFEAQAHLLGAGRFGVNHHSSTEGAPLTNRGWDRPPAF